MAANVVVYEWCNELVAHLPGVIREVRAEAGRGASRARAVLKARRFEGHSKIEVTSGSVDSFVSLDDTAGDRAAQKINIQTGALDSAW